MDDPVTALIGFVLIGFGVSILFGAYKNKKVLGSKGIIPQALATGSLADLATIPEAFPSFKLNIPNPIDAVGDAVATATKPIIDRWRILTNTTADQSALIDPPASVMEAILSIERTDANTAKRIASILISVSILLPRQRQPKFSELTILLRVADANGHKSDADVIRGHVREKYNATV